MTCSEDYPHEAHFFATFIAGGPPGPVPTITRICPGKTEETP